MCETKIEIQPKRMNTETLADAQEQPHPHRAADRDHLDLEVAQGLLVPLVTSVLVRGHGTGGRFLGIEGHGRLLSREEMRRCEWLRDRPGPTVTAGVALVSFETTSRVGVHRVT